MASSAISSMGVTFWRYDSGSSEWEAIAEISAIDGPSKSRETIDVTALDSVGGYREFVPDLRDGGTVSLTMNFTAATYTTMNADFESNTKQIYCILIPDSVYTELDFRGLVTELPLSASVGDKVSANATIKISGNVEMNLGSSTGPGGDASIS